MVLKFQQIVKPKISNFDQRSYSDKYETGEQKHSFRQPHVMKRDSYYIIMNMYIYISI